MAFESVRTRFLYKTLDAVMTARIRPRKRRRDYLKCIVSPSSSRYDRIGALVGLIETLVPGTERRVSKFLMRPHAVPFASASIDLLSSGSGSTVFLLDDADGRMVLKSYRRTIGQRRDALLRLAREYRQKYETVSSWYDGPHEVVVRANFLILHGPMLGRPVVACVQPYVGGEKHDFFQDFGDDELIRLMDRSPMLKEQFVFFARRTIQEFEAQRRCADLLGAENFMVVRQGGSVHLKLIDYGILDLETLENESPKVLRRLSRIMSRLQSLLDSVSLRGEVP